MRAGGPTSSELRDSLNERGLPVMSGDDLEGEHGDEIPVVPDGFSVRDEETANWLVRRIRDCRQYVEHVKQWAASEIRRGEREEQFLLQRYGLSLESWAAIQVSKFKGRRKSLALPGGTIGFRTQPPRLNVVQEDLLIGWCKRELPAAIRVSVVANGADAAKLRSWRQMHLPTAQLAEQVMKCVVNDHVANTGECPDGTSVTNGGDSFYVR